MSYKEGEDGISAAKGDRTSVPLNIFENVKKKKKNPGPMPLGNSMTLDRWLGLPSLSSLSCKMRHFIELLGECAV